MKSKRQNFISQNVVAGMTAIISLLIFSGCSKGSTSQTTTTTTSPYIMTASINGAPFSKDSCSCAYNYSYLDTTFEIVGWAGYPPTRSDYYPQIYLYFYNGYNGIGTYNFSNTNFNAKVLLSDTSGAYAASGSITITGTSPNVTGTFSFTTTTGVVVSNGSFTAQKD